MDDITDWVDGDYPTIAALERLTAWPYHDVAGALDFAKAIWHWSDYATYDLRANEASVLRADPDEQYLRLATGGWSGNEAIVKALNANRIIYALAWRLSAVGGLHIYQYPTARERYALRLDEEIHDEVGRVGGA